ncbi:MAG: T9SS type A sorting domain-containing protein, partial [Ignavibacteriaceae bacterium]
QSVGGEEKIVAAGSTYDGNDYDFALARYNAEGTLDNTFGIDGIVTTKVSSNNNDEAISGVIQSDGKFIAAGHSNDEGDYKFALVRYTVNGFPEKTVTTQAGVSFSTAYSVEIQSDGKIIAAGSTYNGRSFAFALIRYNVDLSLDNSFGTDGIVTTEIGTIDDRLSSIVIQEDGKIVAAGSTCRGHNDYDIALVRYNLNGDLDTTFGEGGIVITQIDTAYDDAYSVAVQKNSGNLTGEKIIIAGTACIAGQFDFALVRYNLNGTLDSSFGANGIVTTKLNSTSNSVARSISIQSNGKLLAAGSTINAGYCDFAIVRYNYNGTLDNSFGTNGIVTTQIGPSFFSEIESVVIQKDGKIIAAGYSIAGANTFFTLACYKGDEVTYAEDENPVISPSSFTLAQNYPNPFNPTTTLSFVIGNRSFVLLKVYDVLGREIATLLNEEKMPGKYKIKFNANDLSSGIYFYRLQAVPVGRQAGEFIETKKMILLR